MTERKRRIPPGYTEQVYYERNPWTGKKYRRTRLVPITNINEPPDVPDEPELLTPEQFRAQRMSEAWNKATSKDGRPPIGGAQDD